MDIRILSVVAMFIAVAMAVNGQSKKTIREKGIVSVTVNEYFIEEGMKDPVVESIEKYNEEGEIVEIKEMNKRGEVRRWEKYAYNEDGKLVEELFLDEKGRVENSEKTIYTDKLRTEKHYFNHRGKLTKKKVYKYEYRQ